MSVTEATITNPDSLPAPVIGTDTTERSPSSYAALGSTLYASNRTGAWVSRMRRVIGPAGRRTGSSDDDTAPSPVHAASTVTFSASSRRMTKVRSTASSRPTSSATAANTDIDGAPAATSSAIRRNAACSSASSRSAARESAFAIAVAISSVNFSSRAAASSGSGAVEFTVIAPHSRPLTTIGLPTRASNAHSEEPLGVGILGGPEVASHPGVPSRPVRITRVETHMSGGSQRDPQRDAGDGPTRSPPGRVRGRDRTGPRRRRPSHPAPDQRAD